MSIATDIKDILGFFSTIPAGRIDNLYLREPKGPLEQMEIFIRIRFLFLLFLSLNLVDLAVNLTLVLVYAGRILFRGEETQETYLAAQKKYATAFGNRFYATLASPVGFIFPKLVVFYFTPEINEKGVRSGGNYYHVPNVSLQQPETVEELQALIKKSIIEKRQIIPIGAGRSQGKQFLPEGNGKTSLIIDLDHFNTVEIDSERETATVGAGARWFQVQEAANKSRLALKVMQASNIFSVGGSIGTNIHGWDHKTGMLSNTILSMKIIDTQGALKTLTPEDELFHYITGGLGLYGIVYSVTLQLTKNEKLKRESMIISLHDYVQYFNDSMRCNDSVKMHYFRLDLDPQKPLKRGFTESYVVTDNKAVITPNLVAELSHGTRMRQILVNIARRSIWARMYYFNSELHDGLNNNPIMTTNEVMKPPINALFNPSLSEAEWLQEYFLPGETLAEFLDEFSDILAKNEVILLNASIRFVKQNNQSPLSYTHDGDRFALVICFNQSLQPKHVIQAKKWLREAQHLTIEKGGSYYLPYQQVSSPEDFAKSFPYAKKAQAYKNTIDPHQIFTSGFHQKYMASTPVFKVNKEKDYVRMVLENSVWRKSFEGFLNHVLQRVEAEKLYALLDDILLYNDSHAEIYQELCHRLYEVMPSVVFDTANKLKSLHAIKNDLGEQARVLLPFNKNTLNGVVEIGSPGRFATGFKAHYKVKGKVYAAIESPSFGDYIDAGTFSPYDVSVKLNYNNPHLKDIPSQSADIITCYVGIHHFPTHKLDGFLQEVKRVLRVGGQFLLVDHDVGDEDSESMAMAHFAHFIFNAVNGVSLNDEMNELRDFKPIAHWRSLLSKHGFDNVTGADVPMIRQGDPTRNWMITAIKSSPIPVITLNKSTMNNDSCKEKKNRVPASKLGLFHLNSNSDTPSDEEHQEINSLLNTRV